MTSRAFLKTSEPSPAAGFTLIELLISITILSFLFTFALAAVSGMVRISETISEKQETRMFAQAVLNRVARELQMTISGGSQSSSNRSRLLPPPERCGTAEANRRGYLETFKNPRNSSQMIEFVAKNSGQRELEGSGHSGLVQISYSLETPREESGIQEEPDGFTLYRIETPLINPCEDAHKRRSIFPIAEKVRVMNFSFLQDDGEWTSDWNDLEEVPYLIRIYVEVITPTGKVEPFFTSVPVRQDI